MMNRISALGRFLGFSIAATVLLTIFALPSFAQQQSPDFEAPLIEHDETVFSLSDTAQDFSAQVVDNIEVSSVKLFYRLDKEDEYSTINMERIADSAFYSASLSSDEYGGESTVIEYYIQAEDAAGNVVLNGFAFAPLTRNLTPKEAIAAPSQGTTVSSEPDIIAEKPKSRVLYYVLGALAVGALASTLSDDGSESSSPGNDSPCVGGTCTVTFTLGTP